MQSTDQHTRPCAVTHYSLPAQCTLAASHRDAWHRTVHPDTGQILQFHASLGTRHTQEWEPDDDAGAPNAGQWVTWHYVTAEVEPTPVVPADLDRRVAAIVASHYPTDHVRPGRVGVESECGCGTWYPIGGHNAHLGREMSLLIRGYFDLALRHGQGITQLAS